MWIEDFNNTENSYNLKKFMWRYVPKTITVGADSYHTFILPFIFSDYANEIEVIYKQGLDVVNVGGLTGLRLTQDDLKEDATNKITTFTVHLNPIQTSMFKNTLLDSFVQLKIVTPENEIHYLKPEPVIVNIPLNQ